MNNIMLNEILKKHKMWLNDEENGEKADLSGADLIGADLSGANLRVADLSGANLRDANLRVADLSGANLRDANLSGANLRVANLRDANLSGADLIGADLSGANLRDANLSGADLKNADLSGADLKNADLSGADLKNADLSGADLRDANLRVANLSGANLRDANLSGTKNLLSAVDYVKNNFECTTEGVIAYKVFGAMYNPPIKWKIQPKSVITENINANRTNDCGCGINVATLEWVRRSHFVEDIWKVLIRWEWMCGVVVPYNTAGKLRCERVELVEMINEKESQT